MPIYDVTIQIPHSVIYRVDAPNGNAANSMARKKHDADEEPDFIQQFYDPKDRRFTSELVPDDALDDEP